MSEPLRVAFERQMQELLAQLMPREWDVPAWQPEPHKDSLPGPMTEAEYAREALKAKKQSRPKRVVKSSPASTLPEHLSYDTPCDSCGQPIGNGQDSKAVVIQSNDRLFVAHMKCWEDNPFTR